MENDFNESIDDSTSENESSNEGSFSLRAEADKLLADGNTNGEASQNQSLDGQRESDPSKTNEKELSPEEILNSMLNEKQGEPQNNELVSKLNELDLIHNGQKFELKSPDEIKELIQKGKDYTQKTMAHSEEVKKFNEEKTQFETQIQEKEKQLEAITYENKIVEDILLDAKENDPEFFNLIASLYNRKVAEYEKQKPLLKQYDQKFNELRGEIEGLKGQRQSEEFGKIKQTFDQEMGEVQTKLAPQFSKLGVVVDWNKVQDAWKADASGKLSVESAVYAVHGKEIANGYNSYKKLLETQNKKQASILGRNSARGASSQEETIRATKSGDIMSILKKASASM